MMFKLTKKLQVHQDLPQMIHHHLKAWVYARVGGSGYKILQPRV